MYFLAFRALAGSYHASMEWDNIRNMKCSDVCINNCLRNLFNVEFIIVRNGIPYGTIVTFDVFISKQPISINNSQIPVRRDWLESCKFNLDDISPLYPCITPLPASSRHVPIDRDKQSRPRSVSRRFLAITDGLSRFIRTFRPEVNFHKRIQISRPRRNLTIPPESAGPGADEIFASEYWTRTLRSLPLPPRPPPWLSPLPRSKSTCALFLYYRSIPLWRWILHYSAILFSARELSFSSYIHRMLNTQDGTLALILAARVTRSTTCTDRHGINYFGKLRPAKQSIFSTDNPANSIRRLLFLAGSMWELFLSPVRNLSIRRPEEDKLNRIPRKKNGKVLADVNRHNAFHFSFFSFRWKLNSRSDCIIYNVASDNRLKSSIIFLPQR